MLYPKGSSYLIPNIHMEKLVVSLKWSYNFLQWWHIRINYNDFLLQSKIEKKRREGIVEQATRHGYEESMNFLDSLVLCHVCFSL